MAGTTFSGGPGGRQGIVGINVTPMVDIVLVLLIIMMVSANLMVAESIKVDLPKASSGEGGASSPAIVTVKEDGTYAWGDAVVTEAELPAKLAAAQKADPDVNLIVSADASARHGAVVRVVDLAKAAGIKQYAIGVVRPD